MVKIFLDANILVDIIEERKNVKLSDFSQYKIYLSPLSVHILAYLYKYTMPSQKLSDLKHYMTFIPFDTSVMQKAVLGPTRDFEDNVQLHSAAEAECDIFLTEDKRLLDMKFFGKVRIASFL